MSNRDSILADLRKVQADLDRIFEDVPIDVRTRLIQALIDSVHAQAPDSALRVIATAVDAIKCEPPATA
jgi:hypothetical protein